METERRTAAESEEREAERNEFLVDGETEGREGGRKRESCNRLQQTAGFPLWRKSGSSSVGVRLIWREMKLERRERGPPERRTSPRKRERESLSMLLSLD